ncbi:MAG: TolC family protein [Rhodothermales bacterium]
MNLLVIAALLFAKPDTLALDRCYLEAVNHYPLRQEIDLQTQMAKDKISALQSNYLPQISIRGDATYQSEIPDFAFFPSSAGLPVISHDQYHLALGAEQLIYDGGRTEHQKDVASAEAEQAKQQIQVELYGLRDRVNQAYFNALLLQAQRVSLTTLHEDLEARLKQVRSRVEQGVLLQSNADVLEVEMIHVEQELVDANKRRLAALGVLGELIGRELDPTSVLILPRKTSSQTILNQQERPEYGLFEKSKATISKQIGLTARTNYPKLAAFGDAAYGRPPGQNILENDFTPYYAFGVRLSWKLWDWKANQRRRQALAVQQEIVDARQATFTKNIELALKQQVRDVERLEELLLRDDEIVALRERIVNQTESQLANGVITATEYLLERNAAFRAELTREQHRIQLSQANIQVLTTIGEQ